MRLDGNAALMADSLSPASFARAFECDMRILGAVVVKQSFWTMVIAETKPLKRCAVRTTPSVDNDLRPDMLVFQQPTQESENCSSTAPLPHNHVTHLAFIIDYAALATEHQERHDDAKPIALSSGQSTVRENLGALAVGGRSPHRKPSPRVVVLGRAPVSTH